MASEGRLTQQTQDVLKDIRARLVSIENRLNRRDEIRFHVVTGTMLAVIITVWVSTILIIVLMS